MHKFFLIFQVNIRQIIGIIVIAVLIAVAACKPTHPQIQDFARDLAKQVKKQVCGDRYKQGHPYPCGDRDVRFEAESWRTVYINLYGVVDDKEISSLVEFTKSFRGEEYKAIPVVMTFYADLRKPNTLKNPKVVYKVTLKGGK